MRQRGFTLIELLVVIIIIGIFAGVTITVINPKTLQNKTNNAVLSAMITKVDYGVKSFIAVSGRYPSGSEIVSSLSRDIVEKDVDSCSILGAVSDECLFSIPRVKTPATCNESGWTGDDSDTEQCFFRYQGGINGEKDRFRIYVKAHGIENKMFVFDSSVDGKIHKCPHNLTDTDGFSTCGRVEIAFDGTSDGINGGGDGEITDCQMSDLGISTTFLPNASFGSTYSYTIDGSGGEGPYTWTVSEGSSLPQNLLLNQTTGTLSGGLIVSGTFPILIQLTDGVGCSVSRELVLTIESQICSRIKVVVHSDVVIEKPVIKYANIPSFQSDFKSYLCLYSPFPQIYICSMMFRDWESMGNEFLVGETGGVIYTEHNFTKVLTKLADLPYISEPQSCSARMLIRIKNENITFDILEDSPFFIRSTTTEEQNDDYFRVIEYEKEIGEY